MVSQDVLSASDPRLRFFNLIPFQSFWAYERRWPPRHFLPITMADGGQFWTIVQATAAGRLFPQMAGGLFMKSS